MTKHTTHHPSHAHSHVARHRRHRHRREQFARYRTLIIGLVLIFGVAALLVIQRQQLAIWWYELRRPATLPAATDHLDTVSPTPTPTSSETAPAPSQEPTPTAVSVPAELNLSVPFTSQAPTGNWDTAHKEYCEEASIVMAARYFARQPFKDTDDADQAMTALADWQQEHFGYFESTTAAETKEMIEANFPLKAELSYKVSAAAIKQALAQGKLVLVPAAGQELGNPYFTAPGPVYHMLVIKGYTADGTFITNDPGTRHGADYLYDSSTLLNAVGDYNHGNPTEGTKVLLLVSKR